MAFLRKITAAAVVSLLGAEGLAVDTSPQSGVDLKGNAYLQEPWDATVHVDLDGKPDGKQGEFTVRVHPEWAKLGAQRFQDLVATGVLNDARFFRVVPDFMAQFGIPGKPDVAKTWKDRNLQDDPSKKSNTRGMISYATAGPNTRTTQMFINFKDNSFLDSQGFAPFAEVVGDGMKVVDKIERKYEEKPDQGLIQEEGNTYLSKEFPDLSYVKAITSSLYPGGKPIEATYQDLDRKQVL